MLQTFTDFNDCRVETFLVFYSSYIALMTGGPFTSLMYYSGAREQGRIVFKKTVKQEWCLEALIRGPD